MTGFLEELEAETVSRGPLCSVSILLADLDPDLREQLETALATARFPSTAIARTLAKRGHRINYEALQRHRRGACRCRTSSTS